MTSIDAPTPTNPSQSADSGSPFLFPIDAVDLNARVLTRAEIERWNPHRGHMALLDGIVWHSDDYVCCMGVKQVRGDEFWVDGHFPGRPLFPGVLMVESGAQLANYMFLKWLSREIGDDVNPVEMEKLAGFTRIEDTVFREAVTVGDDLYILSLGEKVSKRRFISKVQGVVNNRVAFESRITGMLF